jgi:hypothetical protein
MIDNVIASRGFTNDNKEEFSFFVEKENNNLFLSIEHRTIGGEAATRLKVSKELLEEIKTMCEAALTQINTVDKDNETFRKY